MTREEAVDAGELRRAEARRGAVELDERAPEPPAEQEAHRVTGDRRGRGQRDDEQQRGVAALGRHAADEQHQLAVDDEADERAGLEEDQRRDGEVDPAAQRTRGVGERAGQVGDGDGPRRDGDREADARDRHAGRGEASGEGRGVHERA